MPSFVDHVLHQFLAELNVRDPFRNGEYVRLVEENKGTEEPKRTVAHDIAEWFHDTLSEAWQKNRIK